MLESSGIAPLTPSVLAQLRSKHPPRTSPMPATLPGVFPRVEVELGDAIRRLRPHRSPGPSGRRNEYIRPYVSTFDDLRTDTVLAKYEQFATAAVNGENPAWFYEAVRAMGY